MLNTEGIYTSDDEEEDNKFGASYEEDDDDDEEEKPVRRAHARSLFSVEAIEEKKKKEEAKRKLTLTGSLFERMSGKKDKDEEEEKDKDAEKPENEKDGAEGTVAEAPTITETTTGQVTAETQDTVPTTVQTPAAVATGHAGRIDETAARKNEEPVQEEAPPKPAEKVEAPKAVGEAPVELGSPDLPPPEHAETMPDEPEGVDVDQLNSGLGMEGPPEPPEDEPTTPAEDEPDDPAVGSTTTHYLRWGGSGYGATYGAGAPTPRGGYSREDLDDAENRGRRYGTRRGLGAGLLFGWMFGRHGKKKATREHAKEIKAARTEIKELKSEQDMAAERMKAVQNTQGQLRSRLAQAEADKTRASKKNEQEQQVLRADTENMHRELQSAKEALEKSGKEKEAFTAAVGKLKPEQAPKHIEAADEELVTQGNRVETSAWHRIEVDAKTGKVVENPSIEYGEEYKRERSHEIRTEDQNTGFGSAASRLGSFAATFGLGRDAGQNSPSQSANSTIEEQEKHLKTGAQLLHYASKPLIWAVAVILVVVLFAFGLLR